MAIEPVPGTDATHAAVGAAPADISAPVVSSERTDAAPPPPPPVAAAPAEGRRRGTKRIKARQVQRVVTRVDPWSMLKVSLLFSLSLWLIVVVAGVLLWRVAVATGTIGNFENFLAQILAEDSFTIDGGRIFEGSVVAGLVLFVTGAVFAVVTSVLFNLIAGVVGGIRCTVVELETARPVDDDEAR